MVDDRAILKVVISQYFSEI